MRTRAAVCPVQVGRDDELRVLADGVAVVGESGHGRILLIAGEAGVGKSRLAAETLRRAGGAGLARLEGACSPEASIPYACFVNAVRRRTRNLDDSALRLLFDGPAAMAAALLPEVVDIVGLPSVTPATEDLFAAVWQLLARLARPNGAVLLLEDLHWADADSLRLLRYLSGELDDLPVLVVGTYRSDEMHRRHPLGQLLADLDRERRYEKLTLAPLHRDQVRAMVSAILDGTGVGEEFGDAVMARTGGNPFFVEELIKVLVERGDVYHADGDWQRRDLVEIEMPISVRETLLARAQGMDATAMRVLEVAALAADELDLRVLAEAVGVGADVVDDVVSQALQLQLLVESREGARSRFAFRHALTREAFADELVGPARRHAHRALADALVHVYADDMDAVAASVADHFAAVGDNDAAFEFAVRAARRATSASAGDEADHRFDQALRLLPEHDGRRLELLLEAAGSGDIDAISRHRLAFAQEARNLAAAQGDDVAQARAIYVLESARWLAGDGPGALALLTDARALVAGRDPYQEAWVVRRLTRVLVLGDRLEEAAALIPEGIELAERSGNLSALSGLLGTRMMMETYGPSFQVAFAAALDAARAAQDARAEQNLFTNRGFVALWCGDFEASVRSFTRAAQLAERFSPNDRYIHAGRAWVLALRGQYDAAEQLARPLRTNRPVPTRLVALTALAEVAQRRGAPDAQSIVDELWNMAVGTAESQRSTPAAAARARQVLADRGVDAALPLYWSVLRGTLNWRLQGSHWPFSPDLSAALAADGRVGELASWIAEVGAISEADPNGHNMAAKALCQAFLAAAQGDTAAARAFFVDAVERFRAMPCPARVAEALLGLADLGWRTDAPDAGAAAADEALEIARRIGADPLADAARRAVERSNAQPVLATILFTDIVGSTELVAGLGDRGWSELLERHNSVVRRELARARGREIDTAGDGFLAAFDTPATAIRCATAITAALADAGIRVRAGLHTGECRESGGKLTGLTVHIASRVVSAAGPGEVVVSRTVKDLVAGAGFTFEDRAEHDLKGVPGRWQLFAVVGA